MRNQKFKISIKVPSIILCAGSPGVGKSTVMKDILPCMDNTFLLEKDACLEQYLHANPLNRKIVGNKSLEDSKISHKSAFYNEHLRDQVYASMYNIAFQNAIYGKNSILDSSYIKDLKYLDGRESFKSQVYLMLQQTNISPNKFRIPIIYFYATDPEVVKQRLIKRSSVDAQARDRDISKVISEEAWREQISKEPVTLYPELNAYSDICWVNLTEDYDKNKNSIRTQIKEFLEKNRTFSQTGILKKTYNK